MQRALLSASFCALVTLWAPAGLAQERAEKGADLRPSISLGVLGGGHFFAEGTNLGVASAPEASAGARRNALWGLRATLGLGRWAAVEAEAFGMITPDRTYDLRATIVGYRLNALAYLMAANLRPFLLLGAGVAEVVATHADGAAGLVRDRDGELHVGGGLDYRLLDYLSVRADARVVEMPGKRNWSLAPDIEATLALAIAFGSVPRTLAPAEPEKDKAAAVTTASPPAPADKPAGWIPPPATAEMVPAPATLAPVAVAPAAPVAAPQPVESPSVAEVPTPDKEVPASAPAAPQGPSVMDLIGRGREIRFRGATGKLSLVSLSLLGQLAEALVKEPGIEIEIVSHTAASGNARKDLALSRRRAEAIRQALMEREVAGDRLTATGRGSEAPVAPNITRRGRRLNDRIELLLRAP